MEHRAANARDADGNEESLCKVDTKNDSAVSINTNDVDTVKRVRHKRKLWKNSDGEFPRPQVAMMVPFEHCLDRDFWLC